MIQITQKLLNEWFDKYNYLYFDNDLPTPTFFISKNKSRFGQYSPKDCTIEISTAWVRSKEAYINTLLHEMCHLYVHQNYPYRVMSHGYEWQSIADEITLKTHGKYGVITRIGGYPEKITLRSAKMTKYVVFYDYNNNLSVVKYSDDDYIKKLTRNKVIKSGTEVFYFLSDDVTLARIPLRKVHCMRVAWNYLRGLQMTLEDVKKCSTLVRSEFYSNLSKVG